MIKGKIGKIAAIMVLTAIILGVVLIWNTGMAFSSNDPDIIIYVSGSDTQGGPMFSGEGEPADGLWMPGKSAKGVMRIYNNYSSRIRVDNLGLSLELERFKNNRYEPVKPFGSEENEALIKKFAQSMKLKIREGRRLIFNKTIYDKTFFEMLYREGSSIFTGYNLSSSKSFNISPGDYVDLEYVVQMKEDAGNDLQGLRATVAFLVNVYENPEPYVPGGGKKKDEDSYDIPDIKGHWAHNCIITLLKHNIIEPYPDGTIKPDNYITRAEVAVLMGKALKLKNLPELKSPYIDELPDWAKGYIISTTLAEVFEGYPDKTFKANNFILREEIAAVFIRAFKKELLDDSELMFEDSNEIALWAKDYVRIAFQNGVVTGYPDNTFRPRDNMTRAEAFTITCKLLGYHVEHNEK